MSQVRSLLDMLPRGRTLPFEVWERRHAWMVRVLWAHVAGLLAWSVGAHRPGLALGVLPIAVFAALASTPANSRRGRVAAACAGLLSSSALLVHLMDGAVEGHFHFFVMVTLLALYEEWFAYLLAIAFVLLHHGITGTVAPDMVFNHPGALDRPWLWTAVHAIFIAGLSAVNVVSWRLNEEARTGRADSEEGFRSAFADAPTGMALVGLDGVVLRANGALADVLRRDAGSLAGRPLRDLVLGEGLGARFPGPGGPVELRFARPGGGTGWALWHHSPLRDGEGRQVAWISHCVDISSRKGAEAELSWQATHDALTGLPNRERFVDELGRAIDRRRADTARGGVAVLFVDLDDFKIVNDSLGHGAGDRLIAVVAERLGAAVREGDVVARFGGDEFTVLLPGVAGAHEALDVVDRITRALAEPLELDGATRYVSASIGVTLAGADEGGDPHALLRDADAAMYRAKELGKSRCAVFDDSMRRRAVERLELETDLRVALDRGQLRLEYQPVVALADDRMIGVEALVRWDHPDAGLVSPARFIPLAERMGLIVPIGAWVLGEACRQLAAWGDDSLSMSVNVSASQLAEPGFVDAVSGALAAAGVAPERVCLEITETVMVRESEALSGTLAELKRLGVRLAVDDFGVGQASLRHLRALLPVDTLKIDKSFVDGIVGDQSDAAIVESVVYLARQLGVEAVAEGVETAEHAERLRGFGCALAQGYHFARPMTPAAVARMLDGQSVGARA